MEWPPARRFPRRVLLARVPDPRNTPKSNTEWWRNKIQGNRDRDRRVDDILRQRGWTVLRFWEHDSSDDIIRAVVRHLESTDPRRSI